MPNTKPVVDNVETVKYIIEKGEKTGLTNVLPVGAVTKNMAGVEITDVEELKKAGICAISEDGKSVMNSGVYRKAMKNAAKANVPVLAHCEDINLVEGGVINLGDKSSELGVKGISKLKTLLQCVILCWLRKQGQHYICAIAQLRIVLKWLKEQRKKA